MFGTAAVFVDEPVSDGLIPALSDREKENGEKRMYAGKFRHPAGYGTNAWMNG